MKYSQFVIPIHKKDYTYLFNTKNNLSLKVDNNLLKKVETHKSIETQFMNFLEKHRFIKEPNEHNSLIEMFKLREEETLRVNILAHGDCNFRCKYCYEKFEDCGISSNMNAIIQFVKSKFNQGNFKNLHISWFGGEPLLGYKEILSISDILYNLSVNLGVTYHSDMTSNGYLLSKTVLKRLITECHITTFQITIDGSKEGHDNQRILKNGKGTYERILKNIHTAKDLDLKYNMLLRINVSQENYNEVEKFLTTDIAFVKNDSRFRLLFRNVGYWGCGDRNQGYEVRLLEHDISFELSKIAINLGFDLFDTYLMTSNYFSCYAQKKNSYTIDTKGNILKCTVALYNEENKIGHINESSLNSNNHNLWLQSYNFPESCLNCKFLAICKGGACPKKDIFEKQNFVTKCHKMQISILNNLELAILSQNITFELKER